MKNMFFLCSVCLLIILLSACSVAAPEPTQTLTATITNTPLPTNTPQPTITNTPQPPTATEDVLASLVPEGTPAANWNGIPIMPGAIAGEGDSAGYTFTIQSTTEEIQAYYETELAKQGILLLAFGQGQNGSIMLIFMKELQTVSVSIFPYGDLYIVMIVK